MCSVSVHWSRGLILIVMGVSGSGKSTLGRALATRFGWELVEGDDFHPSGNVEKMRRGEPLNDRDRLPWLARLHERIAQHVVAGSSVVVACSALKKTYRDLLVGDLSDVRFVLLCGRPELLLDRLAARAHPFMPPDLLDSQIAALEPPADAVPVPIQLDTDRQVAEVARALEIDDPI